MPSESVALGLKKGGVLCLLRSGDALLLMRRAKALHHGQYVPVGGHIEPFESPRAAALREVREEAGVCLEGAAYCGVLVETSPTKYNWVTFIYLAEVERFAPPACVEGTLEWIEIDRLSEVPIPPPDAHIYRLALAGQPFALDATYDADLNLLSMREEISGRELVRASLGGAGSSGAIVGGDAE